ncbi:MAG: GNAT family N-acetyltransferase [Granulosicoccus sp.]
MLNDLIISGYKPGALADVIKLHMAYYQTNWGFDLAFETKIAAELSEFLSRYTPDTDLFLTAYRPDGECVGSISLDCQDAAGKGAHVRWFIVAQDVAGHGLGRQLMTQTINHCNRSSFTRSYLTTFEGLHAARKLYESFDFKLTAERDVDQWAGGVTEQLFVRDLDL